MQKIPCNHRFQGIFGPSDRIRPPAGGPGRRENTPLGCFLTRLPFKSCQIKNNAGSKEPALLLCYLFEKDAPKTKSKPSGAGSILKGEMPRIFKQCRLRRCDRIRGISTLVRVTGFEPAASCSQRGSNFRSLGHELHLALSAPENLLSGALFSGVSTSSGGHCGQTCGRIENAPVECGRFAAPRERLDCSSLPPESQGRFG